LFILYFIPTELPLQVKEKDYDTGHLFGMETNAIYLPISILVQNNAFVTLVPKTTKPYMNLLIDGYIKHDTLGTQLNLERSNADNTQIKGCGNCVSAHFTIS
jgi:hypothetical protein